MFNHNMTFGTLPAFFKNRQLAIMAIFVSFMALIGTVIAFWLSWIVGVLWILLVVIAMFVFFDTLRHIGRDTEHYIASLSYRINRGEQEAVIQMPIGVLLFNENYEIDWVNPYLQQFLADTNLVNKQLSVANDVLAHIVMGWNTEEQQTRLAWLGRQFEVQVQPELHAIYLMDVTETSEVVKAYEDGQLVIGIISLDNYDEVTERMSDSEISALRSYATSAITDWMTARDIYVRGLAPDRFLMIGYREGLRQAENDKFNLLNEIREATSAQNTPLTLSIGISYHEDTIEAIAQGAQTQLDLALGRGGDQVVVKGSQADARFYGGNTNPMAKRTRVRARVISQALTELMTQAENVMVVGHQRADMDSIGAALGVRRLARMVGKDAWVVTNNDVSKMHADMQQLHQELMNEPRDADALINEETALNLVTPNTLLVLVDHSKPSITESPTLLELLPERLVIIDHHRRGEEFPENSLLTYIESYASSTSELVTELFEYQPRKVQGLSRIEATTLLAGIQLDTKSFTLRAGTRTFDAASYLRSVGADGNLIQNFMKDTMADYRDKSHLIEMVKMHGDAAIVVAEDDVIYDSVVVAQTADALLQIIGVACSFVIARRDAETIGISARSTGTKSVQLVMEQMGGGGHLSNAATQIQNQTTSEVADTLRELLTAASEEVE